MPARPTACQIDAQVHYSRMVKSSNGEDCIHPQQGSGVTGAEVQLCALRQVWLTAGMHVQAQQQRTQGAKMPRNDSEGLWSNGSAPGRGPARNGTSGRPMRGAKRQHASPY